MSLEAGKNLRRVREQLRLRYRDVEEASHLIAKRHGNNTDFTIGLSRLADIENQGTVPSIFRIYSISAIYGLDMHEVLQWYGVDLSEIPQDAASLKLEQTRPIQWQAIANSYVELPSEIKALDLRKTSYISRHIKAWGRLPLAMLKTLQADLQRYALVGSDDWSMYPLIPPGSFVQIDESKRRISNAGWVDDYTRPIYFIEHRNGFRCGWCTEKRGMLIVQSHSASHDPAEVYQLPGEVEIVGQVIAVATRLGLEKRPRKRSSAVLK